MFNALQVLISSTIGVLLAAILAAYPALAADPPLQTSLIAVKPRPVAPEMTLKDLDGKTISLASLKGKVVLVNFWATWCPPCRREFPSMERLQQRFANKPLIVLAVNEGEGIEVIEAFTSQLDTQPTFPILLDPEGEAMALWAVRGLPTTFILDKRGRIAYRAIGGREFDHPEIVKTLTGLTREK